MLWWPGAPVQQQQQQQQQSEVQWEEDEQTQGRYEQCRQQHLEKEDNWEEKFGLNLCDKFSVLCDSHLKCGLLEA